MTPQRIQLRRTKGWRKPDGAIVVARPSHWGNPYPVHEHLDDCYDETTDIGRRCPGGIARPNRAAAVTAFRFCYEYPLTDDEDVPSVDEIRAALAGHDLACWCPLDQPCHADVLLEIANG